MSKEEIMNETKEDPIEQQNTSESEIVNENSIDADFISDTENESSNEDINESLKKEIEALEDRNLRLQAEIQNMQRINTRERQDAAKYRSQTLATALLDVLDNLERALETDVASDDAKSLHDGIEMVYNQFINAFENEKIKQIDPKDEIFDPNFHQAVSMIPLEDGKESQSIAQVLQKGYVLNDRVIRPAMVIVYE